MQIAVEILGMLLLLFYSLIQSFIFFTRVFDLFLQAALNDKETHDTKSRVSLLNSALCDDLLTYILPLRCLEDSGRSAMNYHIAINIAIIK